jgi:hypothetical protein
MSYPMRIDALRSAVEAAGVAMAPGDDEFDLVASELDGDQTTSQTRVVATPHGRTWSLGAQRGLRNWFPFRWPGALST